MIDVIYEDNHIIVVNKPINILSQADNTQDINMLDLIKQYIKVKYNKPGNVYLGLVHRLDRPTSGLMVFAKTSKAASRLSKQMKNNEFKKTYLAVVCGITKPSDTYIDYLIKNEKTNTSHLTPDKKEGKEAILNYDMVNVKKGLTLVKINLKTGRHHQIRVQFAYHGYPLWGDQRYNKMAKPGEQLALFASELSFTHPTTKENLTFKLDPPKSFPWDILL